MSSRPLSARRVYLFAAFALCFVVVLTSLAVSIGNARTRNRPAPGASSEGAIYVQAINLSASSQSAPYRLRGQVLIQSATGPVSRAEVTVEVTLPNGSVERDRRLTNSRGLATYSGTVDQPGTYTLKVVSVSKSGATYDPTQNKQSTASLTVGSGSPPPPGGSPTATAPATATTPAQPTATTDPGHGNHPPGSCGESTTAWHTPVVNGCATGHEHGDAPPQWLLAAGYNPGFTHAANTPNENSLAHKHTGFKGFSANLNGVNIYGVFHMDFNPGGHASRFHSYQIWAQDPAGGVSHWTGWLDYGQGNQTGPNLRRIGCEDTSVRPIMAVNDEGCGVVEFESWYSRASGSGGWSWDFGFNIKAPYYTGGDPANPSTWSPTGKLNDVRRVEAAWYDFRSSVRGSFWATQFGDLVSGPSDPLCGASRSYGEKSYTLLCLEQYIAPSMVSVSFPGNSAQKTYPMDGVVLPN